MKIIVFILFLCQFCFAQYHYLRINFSEDMDTVTTKAKENYTVFDSNMNEIQVHRIGKVLDADSSIVLELPFLNYKTNFIVRVTNVKDRAGNLINENNFAWFYFDGYDPNEPQPYLIIKQ